MKNDTQPDNNTTMIMNATEEDTKRNLREKFMYYNHEFDSEAEDDEVYALDYLKKMKNKHHEKKNKRGGKKYNKKFSRRHYYDEEEEYTPDEEGYEVRKKAYEMFAPRLWKYAEKYEPRYKKEHGHGPRVMADKEDPGQAHMVHMCPVILFFIAASIHQVFRIKFLEKSLAKLEVLYKAKKIIKKSAKKEVKQVVAQAIAVQPAPVMAVPVQAPKKQYKKVIVQPMQQQVVMPVIQKSKIVDIEATTDDTFNYSMEEPLVFSDEISEESYTGVVASKNIMM